MEFGSRVKILIGELKDRVGIKYSPKSRSLNFDQFASLIAINPSNPILFSSTIISSIHKYS